MQYMNKVFYNLGNFDDRKEKLYERLSYESILLTDLEIKPENQNEIYKLYYIPTMRTIDLINRISKDDIILLDLYNTLPSLAKRSLMIDVISSEFYNTNEIEGVKSSRDEIVKTTKSLINRLEDSVRLRFSNAINSYIELEQGNLKLPEDVKDIRKIFDEITSEGIEKENLPDGKCFRTEDVFIEKAGKKIHSGVRKLKETEEYIIYLLEKLLFFLNNNKKCNPLIKNAIFHYYFGYIHPFYDGNGRTARFISSMYLKEDYSWLTALSLSQGTNQNRNKYLKSFNETNQVSMQGELNFFVDTFLEVISSGQNILIDNISNKKILLEMAEEKMKKDKRLDKDRDLYSFVSMAVQIHLFGEKEYLDIKLLEDITSYSAQTIRIKLNCLVDLGILKKISKNPIRCVLNPDYLEN